MTKKQAQKKFTEVKAFIDLALKSVGLSHIKYTLTLSNKARVSSVEDLGTKYHIVITFRKSNKRYWRDDVLHEVAHIMSGLDNNHSRAFFYCLICLIIRVRGNLDSYTWSEEYARLHKWYRAL